MEGYNFCFACELQFGTGYPELGIPVPLNEYQGISQQGSIFPDQAHILSFIQITFPTNHKQNNVYSVKINKNQSLQNH